MQFPLLYFIKELLFIFGIELLFVLPIIILAYFVCQIYNWVAGPRRRKNTVYSSFVGSGGLRPTLHTERLQVEVKDGKVYWREKDE